MLQAKKLSLILHEWPGKFQNRSFPDYNQDDLANILGADAFPTEEYNAGRLNVALQVGFPNKPYEKYLGCRCPVPVFLRDLYRYLSSKLDYPLFCIEISEKTGMPVLSAYGEERADEFFFTRAGAGGVGLVEVGSTAPDLFNKELLAVKTAIAYRYCQSLLPLNLHSVKYWQVPTSGKSFCVRGISNVARTPAFMPRLVSNGYDMCFYNQVSTQV